MSRAQVATAPALPTLTESLFALTVEGLKWYASYLPGKPPTRKADLVDALLAILTTPAELRRNWAQLTPGQQQVVAEVVHHHQGRYDPEVLAAKYPEVQAPRFARQSYSYGRRPEPPTAFDLLFGHSSGFGTFIPSDLVALLRPLAPAPAATRLPSHDDPPVDLAAAAKTWRSEPPEVLLTETERAVFHDLATTIQLVHEGKASIGAATRLPTLATVRHLRQRLLLGDYFAETYDRADEAVRPLALVMIVQAAKWAAPDRGNGSKLALTKAGQALLTGQIQARDIRAAWEAWVASNLLDELSRIRAIKGQQSKSTRLTKPAERREGLAAALRACPLARWVALDDFFRYLRAERQSPVIERNDYSGLYIGWSAEYGSLEYLGKGYWDVLVGSYLRVVLWEYAATLGLIEIAYTRPEESPREFGDVYGLDSEPYLSRYDGLLSLRLTPLGAYVIGLTLDYTPPAPRAVGARPILALLPNLEVVITDARRITPNERAFLERIGTAQSQDVYRLSREQVLELVENGLSLQQVKAFLAGKSGLAEADFPQPVRVFLAEVEQRLGAVWEVGRMVVLGSHDPYLLTELAHEATLKAVVQLGTIAGETVLLMPEAQEASVRRQLRKLGYAPRKG